MKEPINILAWRTYAKFFGPFHKEDAPIWVWRRCWEEELDRRRYN